MRKSSFTVRLVLKTERTRKDGTAPIYIRARLYKEKMELSSSQFIKPAQWNQTLQKVIKHPDANNVNNYLESFKTKVSNAYSQLFIANADITLDAIKLLVLGKVSEKKHTLIEVAEEHNTAFESLLGIKYSYGSYKNYKTTLKYLKEFVPDYCKRSDIQLEQVNFRFCEAFYTFLTTNKHCRVNGANKQLQRLKKIVNYAVKSGYVMTNPMIAFTLKFEPAHKQALTLLELKAIMNLKLVRSTLQLVRDVFLIQCFTGLSYSDVRLLSRSHIIPADNGSLWIKMERTKTKTSFQVPVLQPVLMLLDFYSKGKALDEPIMRVLTNQKMNENLKLIQELAGINKNLTTHLARHTFATTITLSNGVPIETVSSMLGHTKLATTQIYAKVLKGKIEKDMEGLSDRLNMPNLHLPE